MQLSMFGYMVMPGVRQSFYFHLLQLNSGLFIVATCQMKVTNSAETSLDPAGRPKMQIMEHETNCPKSGMID